MSSYDPHRPPPGSASSNFYPAENGMRQSYQQTTSNQQQQYSPTFPPPPRDPTSTKPIVDAVNSAFDNSTAANALPAEVISKIAEQVRAEVINSLRSELGAPGNPSQMPQYSSANQPQGKNIPIPQAVPSSSSAGFQPLQQSTSLPAAPAGPPPVYGSGPGLGPRSSFATGPYERRGEDMDKAGSFYENERSTSQTQPRDIPIRSEKSNSQSGPSLSGTSPQFGTSPSRNKEDLGSRYGERDRNDFERPQPSRVKTDDEETVVEKIWQPLFDSNNRATPRLHQFLRGVALHMIEEFEPKNSLVIGPKKMRKFYEMMKVPEESFPWNAIFGLPSNQLSSLYSSLSCSHHLIAPSKSPFDMPTFPALTPHGFADWMTLFIMASPTTEFDRLAKTVRDWPVSNADKRNERFPKELSRRLFPRNLQEQEKRMIDGLLAKAGIQINPTFPPPPPRETFSPAGSNVTSSSRATDPNHAPRHQSRTYISSANTSEDESEAMSRPKQVPIERERKPYIAREGTGKIYENGGSMGGVTSPNMGQAQPREGEHLYPTHIPPPPPRRERAGSTTASNDGSTTARRSSVYGGSNAGSYTRERERDLSSGRNGHSHEPRDEHDRYRDYSRDRETHPQYFYPPQPSHHPSIHQTHHSSSGEDDPREYYSTDRSRSRQSGVPMDPLEDPRERERRYAAYGDEYEREREREAREAGAWGGVGTTAYSGFGNGVGMDSNPPLGTGQRRY